MNKAKLKTYAPQARKDFIAAVTARANQLGLSQNAGKLKIAAANKRGDIVIIAGQAWQGKVARQRDKLIRRIQKDGCTSAILAKVEEKQICMKSFARTAGKHSRLTRPGTRIS